MMQGILNRVSDDGVETLGNLIISDGSKQLFKCFTLERSWKNDQPNVSCIPTGTYTCHWSWMHDAGKWHYQILNVPNRSSIFLHAGNVVTDSLGCVICAYKQGHLNNDTETDLLDSGAAITDMEALLNQQDWQLTIVNAPSAA